VTRYVTILNEYIGNWDGKFDKTLENSFVHYYPSADHLINLAMILCTKYPLLIPYLAEYPIKIDEIESQMKLPILIQSIREANPNVDSISFSEYILQTSHLMKKSSRFFFQLLSKRVHAYKKDSNGKIITSAFAFKRAHLARLQSELLQAGKEGFFLSQTNIERFRNNVYNLGSILDYKFINKTFEENKSIYIQLLNTFNKIAEHLSEDKALFANHSHFFILFRYIYKSFIKIQIELKVKDSIEKKSEWMKYYYNKLLEKSFFNPDSLQQQTEISQKFQLSSNLENIQDPEYAPFKQETDPLNVFDENSVDLGRKINK
jgi:hypothetical protein